MKRILVALLLVHAVHAARPIEDELAEIDSLITQGKQAGIEARLSKLLKDTKNVKDVALIKDKMGYLYFTQGNWERARTVWTEAFSEQSIDPEVRYKLAYNIGLAYQNDGSLLQARAYLEQALNSKTPLIQAAASMALGNIVQRTAESDLEHAKQLFDVSYQATNDISIKEKALVNKGEILIAQGFILDAQDLFKDLAKSKDAIVHDAAQYHLGRIAYYLRKPDEAKKLLTVTSRSKNNFLAAQSKRFMDIYLPQNTGKK